MLKVPEVDRASVAFGDIGHMPKWHDLPEEFRRGCFSHPWCKVAEEWFFSGGKGDGAGNIVIGKTTLLPKEGVDKNKALAAVKAVLASWEPKHEHKIAGVGFMLSEWFDRKDAA